MGVEPFLTYLSKYCVSILGSFFVIHNFILQFLYYELISLITGQFMMFSEIAE